MLSLQATFTGSGYSNADTLDVFWNASSIGIGSGSVGATAINSDTIQLSPSAPPDVSWLEDTWLQSQWLGGGGSFSVAYSTPLMHFGSAVVGGKVKDSEGNVQSGAVAGTTQVVNSTPFPPRDLVRGAFAGGRQAFTFTRSPQV